MNEAILPSVKSAPPPETPGVYADLASLIRLRFVSGAFSFLPRQPLTSVLAGRHASRLRGRGLNFEEIRRYFPGDDIRQIDWKVTARTRVPHSRVFTEERGRETLLVVDQRLSMFFGSSRNFKSVTAAETAAIAAWRVIKGKDRVSAVVFGDSGLEVIPAGSTRDHVMRLLGTVVRYNNALRIDDSIVPNPGMLNEALRRAERLVPHDALVVIITDAIGHDEETHRLITRIGRHNDTLLALVRDPLEIELPDAGPRVFASGGAQLEVDTSNRSLREAFKGTYKKRLEAARSFLLGREIPLMPLSTDEDVGAQFRRLLGKQMEHR